MDAVADGTQRRQAPDAHAGKPHPLFATRRAAGQNRSELAVMKEFEDFLSRISLRLESKSDFIAP